MSREPTTLTARSAGHPARIVLAAVALLSLACGVQKIWAADIWWQLATGRWIVESGKLPSTDCFSYTARGQEWIELRWLFCVTAYLGWQVGGPTLLIALQAAALAAVCVILGLSAPRAALSLPGAIVLAAGIVGLMSRVAVRPEWTTYVLVAVFLLILGRRLRRDAPRTSGRALVALPLLQVLWVNAHTVFILGPVLTWLALGAHLVHGWLARRERRDAGGPERPRPLFDPALTITALLVTVACLLNPYGVRGALFPFLLFKEMQSDHVFGQTIAEFLSPFSSQIRWTEDMYVAAALTLLTAATFVWNWRRPDAFRIAFWIACVYLAAGAMRNLALLALASTWAALHNLEELRSGAVARAPRFRGVYRAVHALVAVAIAGAAWYVASDRPFVNNAAPRRFGLGVIEWLTPREAVAFLREAKPKGNLLHSMDDGAYFTWALAGQYPVCVDGRLEVYGPDLLRDYLRLDRDWRDYVARHEINTLVLERRFFEPIIPQVAATSGWILVHLDPRDLVFVRDIPEHAELIARWRIELSAPWTPRGPEPDERPAGWRQRLGWVEASWHDFEMALNFLWLDSLPNAMRYLQRAVERFPDDRRAAALLSCLRLVESAGGGAPDPAPSAVLPRDIAWAAALVGDSLIRSGRQGDAIFVLRKGVEADPGNFGFRRALALLYWSLGDRSSARSETDQWLVLRPDDPDARRMRDALQNQRP